LDSSIFSIEITIDLNKDTDIHENIVDNLSQPSLKFDLSGMGLSICNKFAQILEGGILF